MVSDHKQDFEVIEALIEKFGKNGSMVQIFSKYINIENKHFGKGWEDLDAITCNNKNDVDNDEEEDDDAKEGSRLFLFLAYLMVSNVLQDHSIERQM